MSASHETGEVELVGDAALGYQINHLVHHIARAGHHEAYTVGLLQHARCGLHEILWTFLHCDAAEESNDFLFAWRLVVGVQVFQRFHCVVYRADLGRVDAVFLNHGAACEVADTYDVVRLFHTAFLDGENRGVDVTAGAVEVGGMYVDNQRLAGDVFGKHTGGVGQPVVRVDDIKIQGMSQHARYSLVVANLFDEVVGIAPREIYAAQVVCADTAIVVMNTIAQVEILFRRHLAFHTLLHVVVRVLFPHDRHTVGADNLQERLVFIAPGFGDDKRDVHIRLLRHAARQAVTGCAQTTQNMRRKLPTKH